jgi:negative regulator of sigma E activity
LICINSICLWPLRVQKKKQRRLRNQKGLVMAKEAEASLLITIKEKGKQALKDISNGFEDIKEKAALTSAALTGFITLSVLSYQEAEEAANALTAAIANQGLDVDKLTKKYGEWAAAIQQKTVYDADAVIAGVAVTQSMVGHLELTEDLIKATVDFATAKKIDLNTAFDLVGKSIGTNTNALGRYGIEIDSSATKQQKLQLITDQLSSKFNGLSAAQAKGLGSLKQLQGAFGDLLEKIGEQFAPFVSSAAKGLKGFIEELQTDSIAKWVAIVVAAGAGITGLIAVIGTTITILPTLAAGITALGTGFSLLLGPIGIVSAALIGLFAVWKTDFLNIQEVTFGIIESVKTLFVGFVANVSDLFSDFGSLLKAAFSFDLDEIKRSANSIKSVLRGIKNDSVSAYKEAYKERAKLLSETLVGEEKAEQESNTKKSEDKQHIDQQAAEARRRIAEETQREEYEKELANYSEIYEARKRIEDAKLKERIAASEKAQKEEAEALKKQAEEQAQTIKLISDDIQTFVSGGLQGLASRTLSFFSDTMVPGIGGAVGQVFNVLSQNTDQFKETLDNLFSPQFIDNILKNLTYLIESLPSILTNIINYLSENMPAVIQKLVEALIANLPEIISALIKSTVTLFADPKFQGDLAAAMAKGLIQGIADALGDITEAFKKAIKDAAGIFDINIGGGGGGGIVDKVKSWFGGYHGGLIPAYASGGLIDNQLIRATAGEFITNKDSTSANLGLLNQINNSNGRAVSASPNIVVNVNGGLLGDRDSARMLAIAIDEELYRLRQANESRSFDRSVV